jgi:hypothetical protein
VIYSISNCKKGPFSTPCQSPSALPPSTSLKLHAQEGDQDILTFVSTVVNGVKGAVVTTFLPPGTYTLIGEAYEMFDYGRLQVSYKEYDSSRPIKKWVGGGTRIKQISHYDAVDHNKDIIKSYVYHTVEDSSVSNGLLLCTPVYLTLMDKYSITASVTTGLPFCDKPCGISVHSSYSQSMAISGGSYVVYPKAMELIGTPAANSGKTEFEFSLPVFTALRVAPFTRVSKFWREGLPLKKAYFNAGGKKVREERTKYMFDNIAIQPRVRALKLSPRVTCTADAIYANGEYASSIMYVDTYYLTFEKLKEKTDSIIIYDQLNGQQYVSTHKKMWFEDDLNFNVTKEETSDSRTNTLITSFTYANNYPGVAAYDSMTAWNILGPVIEKAVYKNNNQELSRSKSNYRFWPPDMVLPADVQQSLNGNVLESKVVFNSYDNKGRILQYSSKDGIASSFIWDYQQAMPIAKVTNAFQNQIAYTSFEADGGGGWTIGSGATILSNGGITGNKSLSGSVSKALSNAEKYVLSLWSIGNVLVNGQVIITAPLKTAGAWRYFEVKLDNVNSVTVAADNMDEVRLYPLGSQMTTYTYDPLIGMTSQCDANNVVSYYEYDAFSRLSLVRDLDRNIIKKICYNYAGQPQDCSGAFLNVVKSAQFTRNNCAVGYIGEQVAYTVHPGTYFSATSQAHADQMAEADITANGQVYANTYASCRWVYYNVQKSGSFTRNNCGTGQGSVYTYTVPANRYNSIVSQAHADQMALGDINANGQAEANINGSCTYYNVLMSRPFTRNNCGCTLASSPVNFEVTANTFTSTVSQAAADQMALNYINANGQQYANTHGVCYSTCTGESKKIINCACETGIRTNVSSVKEGSQYKCTYYYQWSDNTTSPYYYQGGSCPVN